MKFSIKDFFTKCDKIRKNFSDENHCFYVMSI